MPKRKRVRTKKPDIIVSKGKTGAVIDYNQDDIVVSLVKDDDEIVEVKKPFKPIIGEVQPIINDEDEFTPYQDVKDLLKEHRRIAAEPEPPKIEPSYRVPVEVEEQIYRLPYPLVEPTQKQYGEDFLPVYIKVRSKLRRLVGLK